MAPEDGTHNPPRIDFKYPDERQGGTLDDAASKPTQLDSGTWSAIPYAVLERKSPDYDAGYWRECRALYSGGRKLLKDSALLKKIFPPHRNEDNSIWEERVKRAFYISHSGEIIDHIISGLTASPIEMYEEGVDVEDESAEDPYYESFLKNVSPVGGKPQTFAQLMRAQILEALLCKRAWTQVDLPEAGDMPQPANLAEQEVQGLLDAYALKVDPESVYDWEVDGTDELIWAIVCVQSSPRTSVIGSRSIVTKTYTVWDREKWARYAITYNIEKPPSAKTIVPLVAEGAHTFGRVPLLRLELPDGLWMMDKLCSLAQEYFNKRCALSWAEYKSLFQERYEFEEQQNPMSLGAGVAADENRAINQIHGIGYSQIRSAGDRVEWVGPDSSPFEVALKSLKELRDEMHRITYQMSLSTDNGAAAIGRSADSKKEDRASHAVVLMGLGEHVREHGVDILNTISVGRVDKKKWCAAGMNRFDTTTSSDMIDDAEKLEGISIPSPTFQVRHKYALAKQKLADMGDEASEEDLKAIEKELKDAITAESLMGGQSGGGNPALDRQSLVEVDDGEEDPSEPAPRRGFSSGPSRR